jgi:ssDNA-binding Zn-finger/Zn-ribbon topoisomerase 1
MALSRIVLKVVGGKLVAETVNGRPLKIVGDVPAIKVADEEAPTSPTAASTVSDKKDIKGEPIIQVCPVCGGRMTCYEKSYSLRFYKQAMCRRCQGSVKKERDNVTSDWFIQVFGEPVQYHGPYATYEEALKVAKTLKCACRINKKSVFESDPVFVGVETIVEECEAADDDGVFV